MTCEEHDRQAASTQFVTHTVGRMLGAMGLSSTDIDTRGYEALLRLVDNTAHDSFDLYYGLFLYNTNATGGLLGFVMGPGLGFRWLPRDSWRQTANGLGGWFDFMNS